MVLALSPLALISCILLHENALVMMSKPLCKQAIFGCWVQPTGDLSESK